MAFDIHYLRTLDGATLSYGSTGSGAGLPIVFFSIGTLGFQASVDASQAFFAELGRDRPILYPAFWWSDDPANRDPDYAWDHVTEDVLAAADQAGFERFAIVASSSAAGPAVRVTVEARERVACLLLWTGPVTSEWAPDAPAADGAPRLDWGTYTDAVGLILAGRSQPETARQVADAFRRLFTKELLAAMPGNAQFGESDRGIRPISFDATSFLLRIACPTLVVHRRDARLFETAVIQHVASLVPGAAFRLLDGDASMAELGPTAESVEVIRNFVAPFDEAPRHLRDPVPAAAEPNGPRAADDDHGLTPREIEVLGHIADGQTNGLIAETLCVSPATVARHVTNILRKINRSNRVEAARWAIEHNLTEPHGRP